MSNLDGIDYAKLIDEAMHFVVKKVLAGVIKDGLPAEHHFFITFKTNVPGVMISDELKKKYPEEMTIVIQHQFYDLELEENRFSIVLSFDHVKQNLTIPFDALTSFVDPSVRFGLQFNSVYVENEAEEDENEHYTKNSKEDAGKGGSNVVTLDSFRKK